MKQCHWKEYQDRTSQFFKSLGFKAETEHKIQGVRGVHEVDVFVEGKIRGIPFKWIVECKAWSSNVPKEKVMALISIVVPAA